MPASQWSQEELAEVAKWQKVIIYILVIAIGSICLPMLQLSVNIFIGIRLILILAQAYSLYKLAVSIKADFPVLYVLACIIPWGNVVALLMASAKATKILKGAGIKVGLLGAKMPPLGPQEETV